MNIITKAEHNDNIRDGMNAHSMKSIKIVLDELGYKLGAKDWNCDYTQKNGAEIRTMAIIEKHTGLHFSDVKAKRDDSFKALQKFRQWNFGVAGKRIVYI